MKITFDLDGTLCETNGTDYAGAMPIPERIAKVNSLYDEGHTITIWTARGSGTGADHYELTRAQVARWGIRHHVLLVGKPGGKHPYDLFVDDKAVNSETYFG